MRLNVWNWSRDIRTMGTLCDFRSWWSPTTPAQRSPLNLHNLCSHPARTPYRPRRDRTLPWSYRCPPLDQIHAWSSHVIAADPRTQHLEAEGRKSFFLSQQSRTYVGVFLCCTDSRRFLLKWLSHIVGIFISTQNNTIIVAGPDLQAKVQRVMGVLQTFVPQKQPLMTSGRLFFPCLFCRHLLLSCFLFYFIFWK